MSSKVFAIDMRTSVKEGMLQKLGRLIDALDLGQGIRSRDLVAIKLHFGERGNTAYIRPVYLRQVVDKVKALKAHPFLTDANTLYVGTRGNSVSHLRTAIENGFDFAVVGAPLTIADGLKGGASTPVPIDMEYIKTAHIGSDLVDADVLISVAHFKLHELSGFGGAIKNVGMGGASRRGKMDQHSGISPKVKNKACIGCGDCVDHCAQSAITLIEVEDKQKAYIDPEKCIGCAECILVCRQSAINPQYQADVPVFMKKMVEYTAAALKNKQGKAFFINFLTQISPACDCYGHSDAPLVRDIGILASTDPVAIDQASADLINKESALPGTCLQTCTGPGEDKIKGVYNYIDWTIQLDYGQQIGLGSRAYDLEWLENK
ncbi:MAG: DUF362 domain-containing protein [Proteobacteria bacterium]|nr:DUF362 domain-containing protein [Pseudomonadota bacterium]